MVKNPPANAGDMGSIRGWRRSLGEGNGNPLQYYCLDIPMDRGAWWAAVHEVAKRVGHNLVTKQQDLLQHWKYMIPIHPMIMNTYYVVSVGNTKMSKIQ